MKIFISTTSFAKYDSEPMCILKNKGLEVMLNPYSRKLNKEEAIYFLNSVKGLIAGTETLDREVLSSSNGLKVISRCGVGYDNVDLKAAEELGIKVFNTPDAPTLAVAEITIGLIFAILRKIPESDKNIRDGNWEKLMGNLLHGKKIGIVGLGRIGKKVAELIIPFGVEVSCYDLNPNHEFIDKYKIKNMSLKDLLAKSDIVTLHVSSKLDGSYLIGEKEFAIMKKGAYLINTSRGSIIDEKALVEALKNNKITGAAIDVYKKEPYEGPLKEIKNVVLTPHIGSYAKEARIKMEKQAAENLIKGLEL